MFKSLFGKGPSYTKGDVNHLKLQITEVENLLKYAQTSSSRTNKEERTRLATKSLTVLENVNEFLDKMKVK
jgi:hypothetical protein